MTTITVPLSDEQLERLKELARQAETSPEELVRDRLKEWLTQSPEDFLKAAQYVLQKNKNLYRRLA